MMDATERERLLTLRRQRKATISRHISSLNRLVAERDVEQTKAKLEEMKKDFDDLELTHGEYIGSVDTHEDMGVNEKWFQEVESSYIGAVRSAKAWLRSRQSQTESASDKPDKKTHNTLINNNGSIDIAQLIRVLSTPPEEIPKYDGDPMKYHSFMSIFDERIHTKTNDNKYKLVMLLQYTTGDAHSAIQYFSWIDADSGYQQARDRLQERFGNPYLITETVKSKLKNGKRLRKPHDLKRLADELNTAAIILKHVNKLGQFETQYTIIDVLERCQPFVRKKWRQEALDCKRDNGSYPNFETFVSFVRQLSVEQCDPIYGYCSICTKVPSNSNWHSVTKESSASQVTSVWCENAKECGMKHSIFL